MAIDKQDGMSGITPKQKALGGVLLLVLVVVIWQVWGMFGSSEETPAPIQTAPAGKMAATKPMGTGQIQPTTMPQNPSMAPSATITNSPANPQPMTGPAPVKLPASIDDTVVQQKEFLTAVNDLQMLKLQRDIAETNQAIAAAKLATETTKKSINDLLQTKPTPAPVPAGSYSTSLVNPLPQGMTATSPNGGPNSPPPAVTSGTLPDGDPGLSPYVVISVSMQRNRWSAVLGNAGKLYSVSIGDVLPLDGWVVSSISREGVTMKKNGLTRKVSLVPVI